MQKRVPADAVRVWCGFRLEERGHRLTPSEFCDKLGSIFMPATVMIQAPLGLTAYLPTVLPDRKPRGIPDEIALVFYAKQAAYDTAKKTVGGRAYSDMHALVFDLKKSLSGFPKRFDGRLADKGRYHLFREPVDWQVGYTTVFVGALDSVRRAATSRRIVEWIDSVQCSQNRPEAAIVAFAKAYVVYWEHWPNKRAAAVASTVDELATLTSTVMREPIPAVKLPQQLWTPFKPLDVGSDGQSFNFQFERRTLAEETR